MMAIDGEKGVTQHEGVGFEDPSIRYDHAERIEPQSSVVPERDQSRRKKILRKMDIRIIPMVTILYLLSFLDRG